MQDRARHQPAPGSTPDSAPDPTPDELAAMAYADGELDPSAAWEFERQLADRPALAQQVAGYQRLAVLARQVAAPEPADFEWARVSRDPLQRGMFGVGWLLSIFGTLMLSAWGTWAIAISDMPLLPKLALLALIVGALLLGLGFLRARLRLRPLDPYTEVQR